MKKKNPQVFKPKQKTRAKQNFDKKWLLIGGVALIAVVAMTIGLIRYYTDPMDAIVARVNGANITALEVSQEIEWAGDVLRWEYASMFPDDTEIDYNREFRGGVTFGRAIREKAARQAAINRLMADHATRLGVQLSGFESPQGVMHRLAEAVLANPSELAIFEAYMDEDDSEKRAQALLERVLAGEDFTTLMMTYSEDTGLASHPEGYTFVSDAFVPEFEATTRELEIGEISGLVRTTHGFHIIKRIEPNPEVIMRPFGQEPPPEGTEEELLGAKHILVQSEDLEIRLMRAIHLAFEIRVDDANLVFRGALNNISIEPEPEPEPMHW